MGRTERSTSEASVVIPSAEGETRYRGCEDDPDGRVGRWLDAELAKLGEHHAFNAAVRHAKRLPARLDKAAEEWNQG